MNEAIERDGLPPPAVRHPHPHESAHLHVAGEATYVDDLPEPAGTAHAALALSTQAHARIVAMDLAAVLAAPGVIGVLVQDLANSFSASLVRALEDAMRPHKVMLVAASLDETTLREQRTVCLLYTSPSPRDRTRSRMPSSA